MGILRIPRQECPRGIGGAGTYFNADEVTFKSWPCQGGLTYRHGLSTGLQEQSRHHADSTVGRISSSLLISAMAEGHANSHSRLPQSSSTGVSPAWSYRLQLSAQRGPARRSFLPAQPDATGYLNIVLGRAITTFNHQTTVGNPYLVTPMRLNRPTVPIRRRSIYRQSWAGRS